MLRVKANVTTANPLPLFQYFILIYNPSIISNTGIICNKKCITLLTEDIPYFFCVAPKTQSIDIRHGNSIQVNTINEHGIIAIIKVIIEATIRVIINTRKVDTSSSSGQ